MLAAWSQSIRSTMTGLSPSQTGSRAEDTSRSVARTIVPHHGDSTGCAPATSLHGQFPARILVDPRKHRKEMIAGANGASVSSTTAKFARLDKLHSMIDFAITKVGSAALLRDILSPPSDVKEIEARREAIQELKENTALREFLERGLQSNHRKFFSGMSVEDTALGTLAPELADRSVNNLGRFGLIHRMVRRMLNPQYEVATRISSLGAFVRSVEGCPPPQSELLRGILADVRKSMTFRHSEFLDGRAVITQNSVETRASMPLTRAGFRVTGKLFNVEEYNLTVMYTMMAATYQIGLLAGALKPVADMIMKPLIVFAGCMFFSRCLVVNAKAPLRVQERVAGEPEILRAVDGIGRIDALLSLAKFEERMGDAVCQPVLRERAGFKAVYKGMKHPVVAQRKGGVSSKRSDC